MKKIDDALVDALTQACIDAEAPFLKELNADTNIFDYVDSFVIVNILLETEATLEGVTGNYVPLANEDIFDAEKSPLKQWGLWVNYVKSLHS